MSLSKKRFFVANLFLLLLVSHSLSGIIIYSPTNDTKAFDAIIYHIKEFSEISNEGNISYLKDATDMVGIAALLLNFTNLDERSFLLYSVAIEPNYECPFFFPFLTPNVAFSGVYIINHHYSSSYLSSIEITPKNTTLLLFPDGVINGGYNSWGRNSDNVREFSGKIILKFTQGWLVFSVCITASKFFEPNYDLEGQSLPFYLYLWFGGLFTLIIMPIIISVDLMYREKRKQAKREMDAQSEKKGKNKEGK